MLKLLPVSYFIIADRYMYISSVGCFFLAGLGYRTVVSKKSGSRNMLAAILIVYAVFLSVSTYNRTHVWKDSLSLYNSILSRYPDLPGVLNDRALIFAESGDFRAAINDYDRALRSDPGFYRSYIGRGHAKRSSGDLKGAIEDYTKSLEVRPDKAIVYYYRSGAKYDSGDVKGADGDYRRAMRAMPIY